MFKSFHFPRWQNRFLQQFIGYPIAFLSLLFVLTVCAGCAEFRLPGQSVEISLDMQIKPANSTGVYEVSGNADLPDQTKIAVAAVRYLYSEPTEATDVNPTYSVLDYQETEIKNKQWQTQMNLWQVAKNGSYLEAWQLAQPKIELTVTPDPEIIFLATLNPGEQLSRLEQQLVQRSLRFPKEMVRSTSEGDWYVQVSQSIPVTLPNDKTAPPLQKAEENNDGWGDRYVLVPEPPNPIQLDRPINRRTNAPYSAAELLR